jgi:predicted transcriptional regulator
MGSICAASSSVVKCVREAQCLPLLLASLTAHADPTPPPQCLAPALAQGLALLRHHVDDTDEQSPERATLDRNPPPQATLRADSRGLGVPPLEVIEIGGFYVKTAYDMVLTYATSNGACALVGQSVIESVRLGPAKSLPRRASQCLRQARSDSVGLLRFHVAQQGAQERVGTPMPLRTTLRHNPKTPHASGVEVIEMRAETSGAVHRVTLTYVPAVTDCALMGWDILEVKRTNRQG